MGEVGLELTRIGTLEPKSSVDRISKFPLITSFSKLKPDERFGVCLLSTSVLHWVSNGDPVVIQKTLDSESSVAKLASLTR